METARALNIARGTIFQFYTEQVFTYKNAQNILGKIRQSKKLDRIKLVALLRAEKPLSLFNKNSSVKFTKGLKNLAKKYEIQLPESTEVFRITNGVQLISELAKKRAEDIIQLYNNDKYVIAAAKKALVQNKVIRFNTTEEGKTKLFLYPRGIVEVKNGSRAHRYNNGRFSPLKILGALDDGSGGRFYLQFFLNGINNPVFFLQIGEDNFLGFQHREPYELHCNGIFNEYIATDAKPLRETPEAGDVLCIAHGQYFIDHNNDMKGLARRLILIPDKRARACRPVIWY